MAPDPFDAPLRDHGQHAQWEALAAYLRALPVHTRSEWAFLRCVLIDLHALWESLVDTDEAR